MKLQDFYKLSCLLLYSFETEASLVAQMVESTCNAGDLCLIPRLGRSPGGGHGNHSAFLPGEYPWTEEPGRLQSMGSQRVRHD